MRIARERAALTSAVDPAIEGGPNLLSIARKLHSNPGLPAGRLRPLDDLKEDLATAASLDVVHQYDDLALAPSEGGRDAGLDVRGDLGGARAQRVAAIDVPEDRPEIHPAIRLENSR